ncbi:MAG: DNA polymerase III subunit alpha [Erysipelothrix sp.]|nr:DNA polymerase III subunit alpha [Erysipelothrix sp.]
MLNLLTRSTYSMMNSSLTINDVVSHAKKQNLTHVSLVEEKRLYSTPLFIKECKANNLIPIIGLTLNFKIDDQILKISFIAKNAFGYEAISKLSTLSSQTQDLLDLASFSFTQDLFIFVHIDNSWIEDDFIHMNVESMAEHLTQIKNCLPQFSILLTHYHIEFWRIRNEWMLESFKSNYSFIPSLQIAYESNEDHIVLSTLRAIHNGRKVDEPLNISSGETYQRNSEELLNMFPKSLHHQIFKVIESIEPFELSEKTSLPTPQLPLKVSSDQYLISLCHKGLEKRSQGRIEPNYQNRLNYELDMIVRMGFENYFLLIWDIIRFARNADIPVGPGRGSAAGSLVSYCLGITHVDPIEYGLLFERFLNPERISMPDIDIDFADTRRDEIIEYVYQTYGEEHVAQIVTFGTFGPKMALRDVAKAFDIDLREIETWSKLIPSELKMTLSKALAQSKKMKELYDFQPRFKRVFDVAQRIEGLPRHISKHAAGVVMSRVPLSQVLPLVKVDDGMLSTQFSMEYLESLGLIKMDFLGLKNLTIIQDTLKLIDSPINLYTIPRDDQKTMQLIAKGDTTGVFQLESDGMTNLIVKMKPKVFDDIVATIALYRPGPMENIPMYLKARQSETDLSHMPELIHDIVRPTHGILIYQEQILQTVQILANFSLGKADILRKAMGKKNEVILNQLKDDFIAGCLSNKLSISVAHQMFDLILRFANYGFNKSHSVAYGLISYQMAYLKAHYPLQFYTALLNGVLGSETKTLEYLQKIKQAGYTLYPVSLNESSHVYTINQHGVRLPLSIIKGLGHVSITSILNERQSRGSFKDYYDAIARLNLIKIGPKMIESLIYSGAFDEFDDNRANALASLDDALNYANLIKIEVNGQLNLDPNILSRPRYLEVAYDAPFFLEKERQCLGFYVSQHPIIQVKQKHNLLNQLSDSSEYYRGVVMIESLRVIKTKRGETMAFVSIQDEVMKKDAILWPPQYQEYSWIKEKIMVIIEGQVDLKGSFIIKLIQEIK